MKTILAVMLLAAPACAQLDVPQEALDSLKGGMSAFQGRLAPAPIDRKPIDALLDHLAKDPDGEFTRVGRPGADGGVEVLDVKVQEVEGPKSASADDGPQYTDLVYRRYFAGIEGRSQKVTPLKDGTTSVDEWIYEIGLDGSIRVVMHNVMFGKMKPGDQLEVDKAKSKSYRLQPSDPSVKARWKRLQEQFLKMGRLIEA